MASRRGQLLDGVLLLDKPEGVSSNHALQRAKRALDARKAGHTGTLDPFATGLLVCCLGRATKLAGQLLDSDKGYLATIRFGIETDSGDLTGQPVSVMPEGFSEIDQDALDQVLSEFRGDIEQIPPMYSALKRHGKPLYKYAREGVEVERPARHVTIHELDVVSRTSTEVVVNIICSKGTYIRTLAQDIGRRMGCGAHLSALRRTRVGPFHVDQAIALETLQAMSAPQSVLIGLNDLPADLTAGVSHLQL